MPMRALGKPVALLIAVGMLASGSAAAASAAAVSAAPSAGEAAAPAREAADTAVPASLPGTWQPVVSNSQGAIGRYVTITQPTSVTGVFAELPTTSIPEPGAGALTWSASAHTLSWRGGPTVSVNPAISASYVLPQPAAGSSKAPHILVAVTAGELPSRDSSDTLQISSAPASGGFGDILRDTARGSAVFDGNLYLGFGVRLPTHLGEVWRTADGVTWVLGAPVSFGQGHAVLHVDSFIVYRRTLYAGTDSGQIWRTSDGTRWIQATLTPGYDQNLTDFAVFHHLLYANQAASGHPGGVFRSSDGTNWSDLFTYGEPQSEYTHDLLSFKGSLFSEVGSYKGNLGPGGGEVASSPDGTHWQLTGGDGFGNPDNTDISGFAAFRGALYAGTFNASQGAEVWRTFDGKSWQRVAVGGFGDAHNTVVHELIVFDHQLYAGTENDTEGGEIFRTADGTNWSLANVPGFGTGEQQRIRSFFEFGGFLYANDENDCALAPPGCQQHGWELWRLAGPSAQRVSASTDSRELPRAEPPAHGR